MFRIQSTGFFRRKNRLVSPSILEQVDFHKVADRLGVTPFKARKIGFVAARTAQEPEVVQTCWDGKETTNTARAGDWIVTNVTPDRKILRDRTDHANTYVIKAETFDSLYERTTGANEFGQLFKARNQVDAVYLSGGFDILAPWGQKQIAKAGYLLSSGHDVYGDNSNTFDATYEVVH